VEHGKLNQLTQKAKQLDSDRHNDWLTMQKENPAQRNRLGKKPFPLRNAEFDPDEFAADC
jgi:hypothetical protein